MSTNLKQNEVLTAIPETASAYPVATAGSPNSDAGSRRQPVALEIPVTVNGARAVAGSDKREPFSESTKTVLIFGHGAVVRLSSSVAPGQLIFLTNDKTQKEVVCQVVDSKNHQRTSGYVELEFTEAVAGFWGMRFSSERTASQLPSTPSSATNPPASSSLSSTASLPATTPALKPVTPVSPIHSVSSSQSVVAPHLAPLSQTKSLTSASELSEFLAAETNKSRLVDLSRSSAKDKSPGTSDSGKPASPSVAEALPVHKPSPAATASSSSLDYEEVKIPAWLEPLARNAAAPSTPANANVSVEDETKADEDLFDTRDLAVTEITAVPERKVVELTPPSFGTFMLADEHDLSTPDAPARPNKQIFIIAVAAAVLLLVSVVVWYANQSSGSGQPNVASTSSKLTGAGNAAPKTSSSPVSTPARSNASGNYTAVSAPVSGSAPSSTAPGRSTSSPGSNLSANSQTNPTANSANNSPSITNAGYTVGSSSTEPDVAPKSPSTRAKKPAAVRPSIPAIIRNTSGGTRPDEEMNLSANNQPAAPEALAPGLLVANSRQPVAPATTPSSAPRTGGMVRSARLISSIPPAYPAVAKSRRVGGDVKIDAFVDANGQVTNVKAVSGSPLLQQAAMDAVRLWKYEPAQLDGKPVSMHVTVTVQFHLQ